MQNKLTRGWGAGGERRRNTGESNKWINTRNREGADRLETHWDQGWANEMDAKADVEEKIRLVRSRRKQVGERAQRKLRKHMEHTYNDRMVALAFTLVVLNFLRSWN